MTSYTFIVNGDYCPICGVSAFDHVHPDDTKPKEFKMLTPAKERGEKPETWEELFRKYFKPSVLKGEYQGSQMLYVPYEEAVHFIASEIQSAVEAERRRISEEVGKMYDRCTDWDALKEILSIIDTKK